MKNKIKILIFLFAVVIAFASVFVFSDKEEKEFTDKIIIEENKYTFSRLNIFLKKEEKASINIPDYWEGNYRIREDGRVANFIYLKEGTEIGNIFSIEMLRKEDYDSSIDEEIISESENFYFLYYLDKGDDKDQLFTGMQNDVQLMLKSFKVS